MALEISVLIPHYNDLANLDRCLDLLDRPNLAARFIRDHRRRQQLSRGDRGGTSPGRSTRTSRPRPGAGRRPGAQCRRGAARSAAFAFTDSDCLPDADWLERGLAALQRADIVGGAVTTTASDPAHPTPSEAFELVFAFQIQHYVEHKGFCVTANLFVKRSAFETVGGFRNGISEDEEWGRRAITKGYRTVYAPEVRISHPARRNWEELRRKLNRLTRERYVLTREQRLGRIVWIARSWLILISPVFSFGEGVALSSTQERAVATRCHRDPVPFPGVPLCRVLPGDVQRSRHGPMNARAPAHRTMAQARPGIEAKVTGNGIKALLIPLCALLIFFTESTFRARKFASGPPTIDAQILVQIFFWGLAGLLGAFCGGLSPRNLRGPTMVCAIFLFSHAGVRRLLPGAEAHVRLVHRVLRFLHVRRRAAPQFERRQDFERRGPGVGAHRAQRAAALFRAQAARRELGGWK